MVFELLRGQFTGNWSDVYADEEVVVGLVAHAEEERGEGERPGLRGKFPEMFGW